MTQPWKYKMATNETRDPQVRSSPQSVIVYTSSPNMATWGGETRPRGAPEAHTRAGQLRLPQHEQSGRQWLITFIST